MLKKDDPNHNTKPFYTERNDMSTTVVLIKSFVDEALNNAIFGYPLPDIIYMKDNIILNMPVVSKIQELLDNKFTYRGYQLDRDLPGSNLLRMFKQKDADKMWYDKFDKKMDGHWDDELKEWID